MKLLSLIYYLGIFACGIQGSKKSCQQHTEFCLSASFLAAMGGGMIRDLLILFVFPAAFTIGCILDDAIALCAGLMYLFYLQKYETNNIFKQFIVLTDALGVGTFIAIGIDKAFILGATQSTALCCGIVTALGGGILSALLCGQSLHEVLTSGVSYRIVTALGAFLYICCLAIGIDPIAAQYWLILYTLCLIPLTNYSFRETLIRNIINIFEYPQTMVIPILNTYSIHISNQSPFHYFFYASRNVQNQYLNHTNHVIYLLNFKSLCPRRFARGR